LLDFACHFLGLDLGRIGHLPQQVGELGLSVREIGETVLAVLGVYGVNFGEFCLSEGVGVGLPHCDIKVIITTAIDHSLAGQFAVEGTESERNALNQIEGVSDVQVEELLSEFTE
jgi:hypothetical protein